MTVLLTTDDGPVRILTLNRPAVHNALDPALVGALERAIDEAERADHVRSVVLTGAGASFSAGADLRHLEHLDRDEMTPTPFLARISDLVRRLETSPLTFVAALNGAAIAGGLELALGCDAVVAADTATIGDGHVRNDLLPAAGSSVRLPRKIGPSRARWLMLTGDVVPVATLDASGWIHAIVPPARLLAEAVRVARRLAETSGVVQARTKRLIADLDDLPFSDSLRHELRAFDDHWSSHDVPAALRRFLERPVGPQAVES